LARTIANLDGSEEIQSAHLAEALHLRRIKVNHGKADRNLMFEI
jgi:predicted ATPase with chaperone activity